MNWKKLTLSSCVAVAAIALFADAAQAQSRGRSGGGARGGFGGMVQHGGRNWNGGSVQRGGRYWNGGGGNRWHHRYSNRYCGGYYGGYGYGFYPYAWGYWPYYGASAALYYDGYGSGYGYGYGDGRVYEGRAVGNGGGSVVVDVQQELARAGYYRGSIDGVIGPGTRNAIRAYERRNGLHVDGRIDGELLGSMGLS